MKLCCYLCSIFPPVAQQPSSVLRRLTVKVSRTHTRTQTHTW